MQPDVLEALAGEVAVAIQEALGPVLADVKALQTQIAGWEARWGDLGALRERVAVVETKAAPADPAILEIRDRVLVLETKAAVVLALEPPPVDVEALGALRERLAVMEAKSAAPAPVVLEARPVPADEALVDLRARVALLEGKGHGETLGADVAAVRDRLSALEARTGTAALDLQRQVTAIEELAAKDAGRIEGYTAALQRDLSAVSERTAVLETRAPVAGPAGKDGANGLHGKDGADGLGFEDFALEFDGERTLLLTFQRGDLRKAFPIPLPFLKYQGVYQEGRSYVEGDVVTWGGSTWACSEPTTTKPGDGSKAWRLAVKRGQDGKNGDVGPRGADGKAGKDWNSK